MIEKLRYIEEYPNQKIGVVDILYDKGYFGLGISLCNPEEEKFVKEEGKKIAHERALKSLAEKKMLARDFSYILGNFHAIKNFSGCNVPLGDNVDAFTQKNRQHNTRLALNNTFSDMLYAITIVKSKEDIAANNG